MAPTYRSSTDVSRARAIDPKTGEPEKASFGEQVIMYAGIGTCIWFGLDLMGAFASKATGAKQAIGRYRAAGHEADEIARERRASEREEKEAILAHRARLLGNKESRSTPTVSPRGPRTVDAEVVDSDDDVETVGPPALRPAHVALRLRSRNSSRR